jgi:hypothetical protein
MTMAANANNTPSLILDISFTSFRWNVFEGGKDLAFVRKRGMRSSQAMNGS